MTIAAWSDFMRNKVVAYPLLSTGRSAFGVGVYSSQGTTYAARVVDVDARMRRTEGFTDDVNGVAWIACTSTSAIRTNTKIVVPDGSAPSIINVDARRDETGQVHHIRVTFG